MIDRGRIVSQGARQIHRGERTGYGVHRADAEGAAAARGGGLR